MSREHIFFHLLNKTFIPYQAQMLQDYQHAESFEALWEMYQKKRICEGDIRVAEKEIYDMHAQGICIVTLADDIYPQSLRDIAEPPLGLYMMGFIPQGFALSIVGTRKAGRYGLYVAQKFGKELSACGVIIVSGLAIGIDQAAHKGVLEIPTGKTIAVLGNDIDISLNSPQKNLIEKIIAQEGAVISEFSPGTAGLKQNFPLRNRIIAGLSLGVIVIESPIRSGSLITARYALEYGKEIFVVPAEIVNKNFAGSHALIKQGATLVTQVEDILEAFDFVAPQKIKTLLLSGKEQEICDVLGQGAKELLELQEEIGIATSELLALLTHLEIRGVVKNLGGKFVIMEQ